MVYKLYDIWDNICGIHGILYMICDVYMWHMIYATSVYIIYSIFELIYETIYMIYEQTFVFFLMDAKVNTCKPSLLLLWA